MKHYLLMGLLSPAFLAGCDTRAADPVRVEKNHINEIEAKGEFRSRIYQISAAEHVVIFNVPGLLLPTRCFALVNENTNTSNMHCNDDGMVLPPSHGDDLER